MVQDGVTHHVEAVRPAHRTTQGHAAGGQGGGGGEVHGSAVALCKARGADRAIAERGVAYCGETVRSAHCATQGHATGCQACGVQQLGGSKSHRGCGGCGAQITRQFHHAWCSGNQTACKHKAVSRTVAQLHTACVVERRRHAGVAHGVAGPCHHQVEALCTDAQDGRCDVLGERDVLTCLGAIQHHAGARGHRGCESGTAAVGQRQGLEWGRRPDGCGDADCARAARVQRQRLHVRCGAVDRAVDVERCACGVEHGMASQGQGCVVVTQCHGGVAGVERARHAEAAWRGDHQTPCKSDAVCGAAPEFQSTCVVEGCGAAHVAVCARHRQVVVVGAGAQHGCVEVVGKRDGLARHGVAQHHAGARGDCAIEGRAVAVGQRQGAQRMGIAHCARYAHHTTRAWREGDRLAVVCCAIQALSQADVGTAGRGTAEGGVQHKNIASPLDHDVTAIRLCPCGAHQASPQGGIARHSQGAQTGHRAACVQRPIHGQVVVVG